MGLTALQTKNAAPGMHADGNGLYLCAKPGGKSWIFRFTSPLTGKRREMGIGAYPLRTLAEARSEAIDLARTVASGHDPIEQRRAVKKPLRRVSFADACAAYVDARSPGWRNAKHVAQWRNTLSTYCPFGAKPVADVTLDDVEGALSPIWLTKPETASRLVQRVLAVLGYSHDKGWREGDADGWSDRLLRRLPKQPAKAERVRHFPAMPHADVPAFAQMLASSPSSGSRALLFTVLTGCRSGEVRGATWAEIDLEAGVWTIPASRMKAKKEHRVPLSTQALELLRSMPQDTPLVFPGAKGQPLSDMTLTAFMRRHELPFTVHGFRSSFRDWSAECTTFSREVCEGALAHVVAGVEGAYRRTDLFDKRRLLMQAWGDTLDLWGDKKI